MVKKYTTSTKHFLDVNGFTLIEVVVSIVVAGLVILALATLVLTLNSLNARASAINTVHSIVEGKVEDIRNAKFNALPPDGTIVDFTDELPDSIAEPRSATVSYVDNGTSSTRIEIDLSFTVSGSQLDFDYATVIGELGVGQY